jgi:hypothetical protein
MSRVTVVPAFAAASQIRYVFSVAIAWAASGSD